MTRTLVSHTWELTKEIERAYRQGTEVKDRDRIRR